MKRLSCTGVHGSIRCRIFQVLRAQMILLAADGRRNVEIAEQLNCRREVVAKWRNSCIPSFAGIRSPRRSR